MIENILLQRAIAGGPLAFEETATHFRLVAKVLGMKVTLAFLTKEEVRKAMQPKLGIVT